MVVYPFLSITLGKGIQKKKMVDMLVSNHIIEAAKEKKKRNQNAWTTFAVYVPRQFWLDI